MSKRIVQRAKAKVKHYAPTVVSGVVIGSVVTGLVVKKHYNPPNKVCMQIPDHILDKMVKEGKGLKLDSNVGWFKLKYVPTEQLA